MFAHLATDLTPYLQQYGALGVFLASIIEEVIAPIPSTIVVLSSGFFLVPENATILEAAAHVALKVMLPASLGITLGSLFPYYLARLGEDIVIERFGKFLGINRQMLRDAEKWFSRGHTDEWILLFARTIPVVPSVVIGVFSGLFHIPLKEFLLYTFLGSLFRTFILGMLGWSVGRAYFEYADQLSFMENIVLVLIGAACVGGFLWWVKFLKQRKNRKKVS